MSQRKYEVAVFDSNRVLTKIKTVDQHDYVTDKNGDKKRCPRIMICITKLGSSPLTRIMKYSRQ